MMTYVQQSGRLYQSDGSRLALCYAGRGASIDDPERQNVPMLGPLPCGRYRVMPVQVPHLGGAVFQLDPFPDNQMFGRSAFFIHWDNPQRNFSASEGCIVPIDFPTAHTRILDECQNHGGLLLVVAYESDRVVTPDPRSIA